MKKLFLLVLCVFMITGCSLIPIKNTVDGNKQESNLDHKVYRYMKISSSNTSTLLNNAYIFGDPGVVGSGDNYYYPCFIASFDPVTGKVISVKYYSFFLDYEGSYEWVDKAIEKFNESGDSYKKDFTSVSKGRVSEFVTYLSVDINPKSYTFDQYIQILFEEQDIEKYKDTVYYSRLYNYETKPPVKEGDNYFEDSLTDIRIEWSDSILKAY